MKDLKWKKGLVLTFKNDRKVEVIKNSITKKEVTIKDSASKNKEDLLTYKKANPILEAYAKEQPAPKKETPKKETPKKETPKKETPKKEEAGKTFRLQNGAEYTIVEDNEKEVVCRDKNGNPKTYSREDFDVMEDNSRVVYVIKTKSGNAPIKKEEPKHLGTFTMRNNENYYLISKDEDVVKYHRVKTKEDKSMKLETFNELVKTKDIVLK